MSENYKVLGQVLTGSVAGDSTTIKESVAYTVPANTQASISAIEITNSDTTSKNYTLSFVKAEDVASSASTVSWNTTQTTNVDRFVGIGYYGDPTYSNDGLTWYSVPNLNAGESWQNDPVCGNGKIVVNTIYGKTAYSEDGITWTVGADLSLIAPNNENFWGKIAYGNGKFVAVSLQGIAVYSSNGINWTNAGPITTVDPYYQQQHYNGVTFTNNKFVATQARSGASFSEDGITWRFFSHSAYTGGSDVVYAFGAYYKVDISGYIFRLTDAQYAENAGYYWTIGQLPVPNATWIAKLKLAGEALYAIFPGYIYKMNSAGTWTQLSWVNSSVPEIQYINGKYILSGGGIVYKCDTSDLSLGSGVTVYEGSNYGFYGPVMYKDGFYYRLAHNGPVGRSADLVTWTFYSTIVNGQNTVKSQYNAPIRAIYSVTKTITNTESIPVSFNKQKAVYNKAIASGESHEIKGGVTLSAGDQVRIYSQSNAIIANIYGVEIA